MSLPSWSVPRRWWREGAWRVAFTSMALKEYGASSRSEDGEDDEAEDDHGAERAAGRREDRPDGTPGPSAATGPGGGSGEIEVDQPGGVTWAGCPEKCHLAAFQVAAVCPSWMRLSSRR